MYLTLASFVAHTPTVRTVEGAVAMDMHVSRSQAREDGIDSYTHLHAPSLFAHS